MPRPEDCLEDWLAGAEARVWSHGDWDCLLAVADWIETLTGEDLATPWRGTYCDHSGAEAWLAAAGGMARMLDRVLVPRGWRRTRDPRPGAVGVIQLQTGRTRFGAVRYGRRWVMATRPGMVVTQGLMKAAWAPPEGFA